MCEWGTSVRVAVTIPAHLSGTGEDMRTVADIDSCIAPIVEALNHAGVSTVASCCGHGRGPGNIALADGREIVIVPDHATGRRVDALLFEGRTITSPMPAPATLALPVVPPPLGGEGQ